MADDIFEKMWTQLERIYNSLHSAAANRLGNEAIVEQVLANGMDRLAGGWSRVRQTLGFQDTQPLSDTAAIEVREETRDRDADGVPDSLEGPMPARQKDTAIADQSEHNTEVASEIRSAIQELGPVIAGAVSQVQPTGTGESVSGDTVKGSRQSEQDVENESALDRIGDSLDRILELLGAQVEGTQQVITETKSVGEKSAGLLSDAKQGLEALATIAQLLGNDAIDPVHTPEIDKILADAKAKGKLFR